MSVKAQRALTKVRIELGDEVEPYFWSDTELLGHIDEAQVEFCRKGYPIRDSRTPEICHLKYSAGTTEVKYHETIRRVLTVVRMDSNEGLHKVDLKTQENTLGLFSMRPSDYGVSIDSTRQLNRASDNFEIFTDYDEDFLRLSSPAASDGTLLLQVERLPKDFVDDCNDILEIRREHIPAIVAWACFRAWIKQDAETFDEKAAKASRDLFDDHAYQASIEYKKRYAQPGIVKYGGV
jgi:hypothetical protein